MKVRRNVASIPFRSAAETWNKILELVVGAGSHSIEQLSAARSILESIIADELPSEVPIVFGGSGARLVIYLVYNGNAIALGEEVDPLNWNPTESDWRVTVPCEKDDVTWMSASLGNRSPRITVHDIATPPSNLENESTDTGDLKIDWGVLESR